MNICLEAGYFTSGDLELDKKYRPVRSQDDPVRQASKPVWGKLPGVPGPERPYPADERPLYLSLSGGYSPTPRNSTSVDFLALLWRTIVSTSWRSVLR